ncbi:hypothetical protein EVAR_95793_1 [Eumeta japonica]|uniref:Uncharacterized protein n=1 Tax=Eumeta variegata TaxID=151549 RepID=A0A4C1W3L2_EUMVA|nr:hypothetical protein EVAR_95793_1 [Eumeta japonica]
MFEELWFGFWHSLDATHFGQLARSRNTRTLFVLSGHMSASPMTPDNARRRPTIPCLYIRVPHPAGVRSDIFGETECFRWLFVSS